MAEKGPTTAPRSIRKNLSPRLFRRHWKVFSETRKPVSYHPHRPWDHKIELTPNAPNVINSKVYPLSPNEQKVLNEYLEDNLEKRLHCGIVLTLWIPDLHSQKRKTGPLELSTTTRRLNEFTIMDVTPAPPHLFHLRKS